MNPVSKARFEDVVDLKKHTHVAFRINLQLQGANLEESCLDVTVLQDSLKYELGLLENYKF